MRSKKYERLLQPGYIGPVMTKSRLIKTGSNPGFYPYDDGMTHQQIVDYYEALAAGGVGLVTVGGGEIDYPIGTVPDHGYRHDDMRYVPSLRRVVDAIHAHDCPAFIQLFHMGPMHPAAFTGLQHIAASSLSLEELPRKDFTPFAKEMTLDDIKRVQERFVNAAAVAHEAGFDGVELNFACNHLGNSFLSRAWNKRHDEYGCDSVENRARFMVETIRGMKEATGRDFPIAFMLNSLEAGLKDGVTLDECKAFATMAEQAGVDAIHPRVEFYTNPRNIMKRDSTHFPDMVQFPTLPEHVEKELDFSRHGEAAWVPAAAEVKKVVSVPVIAVGRLSPDLGESILRAGQADFISHNRRLMADHDLPRKIAEGRPEDIAPCTACMTCFARVEHGETPGCRTNAALGREKEYEIEPAAQRKKVMVVGGGPAALEAARVAALRGHEVSLYTAMRKLGGSMLVAAVVKGTEKEDLPGFARYYETQMKKLGVDVHRGVKVTPELVKEGLARRTSVGCRRQAQHPRDPGDRQPQGRDEREAPPPAQVLPQVRGAGVPAVGHQVRLASDAGQRGDHHRRAAPRLPDGRVPGEAGQKGDHRRYLSAGADRRRAPRDVHEALAAPVAGGQRGQDPARGDVREDHQRGLGRHHQGRHEADPQGRQDTDRHAHAA